MLRLLIVTFVVLSVIYLALSLYSRAKARDRLEAEWDEGGVNMPREAYVREGLRDYDTSLRRKLILGVYVVPICLISLIVYLVNFA
ncbi:MAG: hypothetical protein AAFP16_10615 [Pseudomonadota bacterium]